MKSARPFRLSLLALLFAFHLPLRAGYVNFIDYSWWESRYAIAGLFSNAGGSYTRDAHLPDQSDVHLSINDSSTMTNREIVSIRVSPPGDIFNPTGYTARAQSDFGQNRVETKTDITGFGESDNRQYHDNRTHAMVAESVWIDHWTFSGSGLGTAMVTLSARFDVALTNSPCVSGDCSQIDHPVLTREGLNAWWYRLLGSIRIFDLDEIDLLIQPDNDDPLEVPREVASFEVFRQGSAETRDFFFPFPPYVDPIPNARLNPVHSNGSASFQPVSGHRYAVVGQIHVQSRDGADVDGFHTLSMDPVVLGPGLHLASVAKTDLGASFRVVSATLLNIVRTGVEQVTLSFPSITESVYHVEFKNALSDPTWTPLASRPGDGNGISVIDSNANGSTRFYRLRVE